MSLLDWLAGIVLGLVLAKAHGLAFGRSEWLRGFKTAENIWRPECKRLMRLLYGGGQNEDQK